MSNIAFWIKRNSPTLIFGGTFGLLMSYFSYNAYQQSRFVTPVVSQTVNILTRNQRIKQLLGFPLAYKSTTSRSVSQRKQQTYYAFTVEGPRGSTDVQVTSQCKLAKDIYDFGQIQSKLDGTQALSVSKKIQNKQLQLSKVNEQIQGLKAQVGQSKSFFKSKQNQVSKQQLNNKQIQKIKISQQLQGLKDSQQAIILNKNKDKNDYYIPLDSDIYNEILSSAATGKDLDKLIPGQLTLCKINQLSVQLPNKSRISIISQGKNLSELGGVGYNLGSCINPTYQAFNQKLKVDLTNLTKEQLSFYSKNKTDSMYKKYSLHKILITIILGSCFIFGYNAFKSRKIVSVSSSVLTQIVDKRFRKNPKIVQLSKKIKEKKGLRIDQMVQGGIANNKFDCSVSVQGVSMGKIQFSGIFNQKKHQYQFSKLQFSYKQDNQTKRIDLLI